MKSGGEDKNFNNSCPLIEYIVKDFNNGRRLYNKIESYSKRFYPKNWEDINSRLFLNLFSGGAKLYVGSVEDSEPWIYSCIRREAINNLREKIREKNKINFSELDNIGNYIGEGYAQENFIQNRFDSPEEELIKKETEEIIEKNILNLNSKHRFVIRLFYWGGFTNTQIHEILNIPRRTVENILYVTRNKFAKSKDLMELVN